MALTQKEYEELFNDGEKKLERLRSAYEQYFQGMEKLQPATQFKAVERIFYVLLREKPRSTNLRFRANQLIQKWSTYQMYWKRVCRQIEEGTHKKQIEKAKARRAAREAEARGEGADTAENAALEGTDAASPAEGKARPTGKTDTGAWEIDPNENFELDMDEFRHDSESKAREPKPKSAPPAKPKSAPPAKAEAAVEIPVPTEAKQPSSPPGAAATGGYRPPTPGSVQTKKDQTASRGVRLPPPGSKPTGAAAAPIANPAAPKPPAPPASPAKPPMPPAPPKVAAAPKPPGPPGLPKPAAPAKPPPGVSPIASGPKPAAGPDEAEMRRVYERYVAARKKNNEAVENVKFEKVRAQIEKMMPTLEQKHKGKRIEFDVVVKDGKVGLKPVPKDEK